MGGGGGGGGGDGVISTWRSLPNVPYVSGIAADWITCILHLYCYRIQVVHIICGTSSGYNLYMLFNFT